MPRRLVLVACFGLLAAGCGGAVEETGEAVEEQTPTTVGSSSSVEATTSTVPSTTTTEIEPARLDLPRDTVLGDDPTLDELTPILLSMHGPTDGGVLDLSAQIQRVLPTAVDLPVLPDAVMSTLRIKHSIDWLDVTVAYLTDASAQEVVAFSREQMAVVQPEWLEVEPRTNGVDVAWDRPEVEAHEQLLNADVELRLGRGSGQTLPSFTTVSGAGVGTWAPRIAPLMIEAFPVPAGVDTLRTSSVTISREDGAPRVALAAQFEAPGLTADDAIAQVEAELVAIGVVVPPDSLRVEQSLVIAGHPMFDDFGMKFLDSPWGLTIVFEGSYTHDLGGS